MTAFKSPAQTAMILVIDPSDRDWESGIFESLGPCEVVRSWDPAEGVGHFVYNRFDIVIVCLSDNKYCLEILRFLKSGQPSLPVIVIADDNSEDFIIPALRSDLWDFFKGAFNPIDIVESVREALQLEYDDRQGGKYESSRWRVILAKLLSSFSNRRYFGKCN